MNMGDKCLLITLVLLLCVHCRMALDGSLFETELKRLATDAIGVHDMQAFYDSLDYTPQAYSGKEIAQKMASSLGLKFSRLTTAVEKIKDAVENDYHAFGSKRTLPLCCEVTGTMDSKFRIKVNFTTACISESPETSTSKRIPTRNVQEIMKTNYMNNPDLLWQYFGGVDGSFITYPSQKLSSNCGSYDPRYRPYYVATASPMYKDLVVVIDTSKSMSTQESNKARIILARDAAQTIVDTLTPNDRIGIVAFSKDVKVPDGCYGSKLATATTTNKNKLKEFINRLEPDGETHYIDALEKAFDFFKNSNRTINGEKREQMLLFLTDGDQTDSGDPLDVIKVRNEALGNRVTILTYALGIGLGENGITTLKKMATQEKNNNSYGEIPPGRFQHIEDPNKLRSVMAKYYTHFSTGSSNGPVFSVPYFDKQPNKSGLITSLCLPVYNGGSLIGVSCTDILQSQLLSEFTYFKEGELSYAFMIDGQGRVIVHYLLPIPQAFTSDPDPISIDNLERSPGVKSIIESMKRGENGNKTIMSQRTVANGVLLYEGIQTRSVKSHYHWQAVNGSNYSLCIVLGEGDEQETLQMQSKLSNQKGIKFVYHRRDLYPLSYENCKQYSRFATKAKSMVMLTPHAFIDPYKYLHTQEAPADVKRYTDYFNELGSNPGVKQSIKADVEATYQAELIWKNNQNLADYVIWRYLGTLEGIVRVYPAVQITHDYDHYHRAWWKRTNALKGLNVVITPYEDLWGAGMVVTQCHSLYKGKKIGSHSKNDIVDAVMCIDFPFLYFNKMFLKIYPECESREYSCMVIDVSGFLVIHPDFDDVTDEPKIERIHLGSKDHIIMYDLIRRGAMTKNSCVDFESNKDQYTYRVESKSISMRDTNGEYEFIPVHGSNVFIIKKKKQLVYGCCNRGGTSPNLYVCTNVDCCLCNSPINYDVCLNQHNSQDSSPTCSARQPDSNTPSPDDTLKIKNLEACFDPKCHERKTESKCYEVAGCGWCTEYHNRSLIPKPKCNILNVCPFGRVGTGQYLWKPPPVVIPNPDKTSPVVIICVVVGIIIVVAVVAVVVVLRCKRRQQNEDVDPYLNVVHRTDKDLHPPSYEQSIDYHAYDKNEEDTVKGDTCEETITPISECEEQRYV